MDLYKKIRNRYNQEKHEEKRGERMLYYRKFKEIIHNGQPWNARRIIAWFITGILGLFAIGAFLGIVSVAIFSINLPNLDNISVASALATEIYDRNGTLLYTIHGEENREYVDYEKISPYVKNATIAIEDDGFWTHSGFDMQGIAAAGVHELFGIGKRRGGSTITQQYVKNHFLTPDRNVIRKIRELILAIRLEQKYDKKKILELYLNQIPYGNNAYGIQRAAQIYFGKNASDLTIAESAILVSIPQAPSYYNPYGSHRYSTVTKTFSATELKKRTIKEESDLNPNEYALGLIGKTNIIDESHQVYIAGRADAVLRRMLELKLITQQEKDEAWRDMQTTQFLPFKYSIKAPHFIFYVRELLEQTYGKDLVEQGGLKVYTTLDWKLQERAENIIATRGEANEKTYKAGNTAALFMDPKTGQILSMVGSRDYFNDAIDGKVNVTLRQRLPGSTFKPIVYAQAFLQRYTPATILYDTPVAIGPDHPQNFDGAFQGPLSIRRALGQSRNIPAIKAYFLDGEQNPIIELAAKLGITTLDKTRDYGYPLAIGAGEVKMIDLVTAYATFADGGKRPIPTAVLKVVDREGNTVEEWKPESVNTWEQALDPEVAYLITDILSDVNNHVTQNLVIPGHTVAAKTGTSTNKTKSKGTAYPMDLWTIGYSTTIAGAVWSGNNRGDPLSMSADGSNVAGPIWKEIMSAYLNDRPDESFPRPEGIKEITVSSATGLLPGKDTPPEMLRSDIFASFAIPTETETVFTKIKVDKRNDLLANDDCPADMAEERTFQIHQDPIDKPEWQAGINQWLSAKKEKGESLAMPPTEPSPLCKKEDKALAPSILITSPVSFSSISGDTVDLRVLPNAPSGIKDISYFFNETPRRVVSSPPFIKATIPIPKFAKPGQTYTIKAIVRDKNDYTGEASIQVRFENTATTTPSTTPQSTTEAPSSGNTDATGTSPFKLP